MNIQAQIYLADQRGCSQTDDFRSFHTFNFGNYTGENREAYRNLQAFNDDTLRAEHSVNIQLSEDMNVVLIPIVGGLEYHNSLKNGFLGAGEGLLLSAAEGMEYEIINPYPTEYINFIQIWLKNESPNFTPISEEFSFDLNQKNQLHAIFSVNGQDGFIGKYEGRRKEVFKLNNPENGIFVFVIDGAFEVQDRLLQARDGLNISGIEEIDFEALSDGAVILLLSL